MKRLLLNHRCGAFTRVLRPATRFPLLLALFLPVMLLRGQTRPEPTEHWLEFYGLESWQVVFDHDFDGFSTREEFDLGTNPLDSESRPIRIVPLESGVEVQLENPAGLQYELQVATDLSLPWETSDRHSQWR